MKKLKRSELKKAIINALYMTETYNNKDNPLFSNHNELIYDCDYNLINQKIDLYRLCEEIEKFLPSSSIGFITRNNKSITFYFQSS